MWLACRSNVTISMPALATNMSEGSYHLTYISVGSGAGIDGAEAVKEAMTAWMMRVKVFRESNRDRRW